MAQEITPPFCPNCNSELKQKVAKNDAIYYACPNWKPQGRGCEGFQWFPEKRVYATPKEEKQDDGWKDIQNSYTPPGGVETNVGPGVQPSSLDILKEISETLKKIERALPKNE